MQAAKAGPTYVVDTSSWIIVEDHPAQNQILSALTALLEVGRLRSVPEAEDELTRCSVLRGWLKPNRKEIFRAPANDPDYYRACGAVTARFPSMAGARGRKNKADPWIIACALRIPGAVVVANETTLKRPNRKIPTACKAFGVKCDDLITMLAREFPDLEW